MSGGYVNYMQADEPIERVRAAVGDDAFGRLRALKGRYDPDNILHRNQNIPPPLAVISYRVVQRNEIYALIWSGQMRASGRVGV